MTEILIIDDEKDFGSSLQDVLEAQGYIVEYSDSGISGIKKIESKDYDLVLLDVKMPVMNGIEVLKRIKKIKPQTTVMMMTAYSMDDLIRDALQNDAFGCLPKPLNIPKLLEEIKLAQEKGTFILITDDDPGIRETLKDVLENKGFKVFVASNGEEAIARSKELSFDILLLDLKLPTLNGLEVYMEIKKFSPHSIAIMMTAYKQSMGDLVEAAINDKAYTCFEKPLDLESVLSIINTVSEKIKKEKASDG